MEEKNLSANEYIKLAEQCEDVKQFATAMKYYQKAFELDPRQKSAQIGVERMQTELANQVFFKSEANYNLFKGRLELRNGVLAFVCQNGGDRFYQISDMENFRGALGRLTFDYPGEPGPVGFGCKNIKEWIGLLSDAQKGKYPTLEESSYNTLEKYIADHFTRNNIEDAIEYCTQMAGIGYADARAIVEKVIV